MCIMIARYSDGVRLPLPRAQHWERSRARSTLSPRPNRVRPRGARPPHTPVEPTSQELVRSSRSRVWRATRETHAQGLAVDGGVVREGSPFVSPAVSTVTMLALLQRNDRADLTTEAISAETPVGELG